MHTTSEVTKTADSALRPSALTRHSEALQRDNGRTDQNGPRFEQQETVGMGEIPDHDVQGHVDRGGKQYGSLYVSARSLRVASGTAANFQLTRIKSKNWAEKLPI